MRSESSYRILALLSALGIAMLYPDWSRAQKQEPATKAAAIVNGETILLSDVDEFLKKQVAETGPALAPLTVTQQRQERLAVLTGMIDETLVKQFLRESGMKVAPAEIEKSMQSLVESLKNQKKTLAEYCKESKQTEQQLRSNIEQMLQLNSFVKSQITEENLKQYFEANKDFFDKSMVRASHIVIRVSPDAKANQRLEAKEKLIKIRKEIIEGKKDFAVLAKEHSHCPSAPKGGDIGFIYRKWQVDESFAKAAFELKVNEISEVVETDFGVHLIKVTERKPGMPSKFELCLEDIRDCFAEDLRQNLLGKLRQKAKIEILLP